MTFCNTLTGHEALLSHHLRSFFLKQMDTITEAQRQASHRKWETLEHSALKGVSLSKPSTQGSGSPKEGGGIVLKIHWRTLTKQDPLHQHDKSLYELTETEDLCTGPAPDVYIMASSLAFSWDSHVYLQVGFLCLLLGSFPSNFLSNFNVLLLFFSHLISLY